MNEARPSPQALIEGLKDLVTLPEVALRVSQMADDPNCSASDIGREISNDAALTSRLLRVANSAAYGQHGKIATIARAITILGVRQVRDLAVGLTAIRTFDGITNELVTMRSFWRQSVLCAVAAGQIAEQRGGGRGDASFVAGLLHDIGQLVLFSRTPELAKQALMMSMDAADDLGLYACERKVLGFDHCAVGLVLAQKWGLPASLQDCIFYHHEPDLARTHQIEVATVHIANSIAVLAEIGSVDPNDAPAISAAAWRTVKLDPESLKDIVSRTEKSATDILPLFLKA